jgi:hypothetical protein
MLATRFWKALGDPGDCALADFFDLVGRLVVDGRDGAITFLERQKRRHVRECVNRDLRNARRGPAIGFMHTLDGYIALEHGAAVSPWARVYYALRCGKAGDARAYCQAAADSFDADFLVALGAGGDFTPQVRASLRQYLSRETTLPECDTFKALALAVVLGEGPVPPNNVLPSIEDWMWVKLKITDPASRAGIREEIRAKRGWDVQSNAFIEPYAHLLCGDAAGAAALLLASDVDIDEGLHLLLAMCHHRLLDDGGRRLVYPHLYAFVTEVFAANQEAALRYFSLIPDEPLVIEYIAKLAVEVENGWEMFQPDSRIAQVQLPAIANVLDIDIREPILDRAAKIAEDRGEYRKAARLHAFAGRFASVVELDCTQLIQRIN